MVIDKMSKNKKLIYPWYNWFPFVLGLIGIISINGLIAITVVYKKNKGKMSTKEMLATGCILNGYFIVSAFLIFGLLFIFFK